jgi:cell division protein FtsW (lipid II flippase)
MQPYEKIPEYSRSVCDQIRWKKAHPVITEEIENHLVDQRDAYMAEGKDEIAATDHAIAQMGDPVIVGMQLDRTHRPKPQWGMLLLATGLVFMGIFIRSFIVYDGDRLWQLPSHLIASIIGLGMMAVAYFSDFTLIGRYPKTVYFSILALSIAVLVISPIVRGRAYYANFMPLLFPLGFVAILYVTRGKGYPGIILCGISFLLPAFISLFVPSISGLVLYTVTGLIILSIAIVKRWFRISRLFGCLLVYIPAAVTLLFALMSIRKSLQIALDPSIDPRGMGYIGTVTRALLDGSKLFGRGEIPAEYGIRANNAPAFPFSNIDTDFLLTWLIFNVGWIAFIIIMSVMLFFIIKGFILCFRQKSALGLFVSVSVILTFTMQVIIYVAANLGFQLIAPISLPLISYGKIATCINLALIGLMLSVFRTGNIVRDKSIGGIRKEKIITCSDGKLIISFSRK